MTDSDKLPFRCSDYVEEKIVENPPQMDKVSEMFTPLHFKGRLNQNPFKSFRVYLSWKAIRHYKSRYGHG